VELFDAVGGALGKSRRSRKPAPYSRASPRRPLSTTRSPSYVRADEDPFASAEATANSPIDVVDREQEEQEERTRIDRRRRAHQLNIQAAFTQFLNGDIPELPTWSPEQIDAIENWAEFDAYSKEAKEFADENSNRMRDITEDTSQ
jgi:hypothetical protein